MAQMQTLSIRIPNEDFQWLMSLESVDAKTPSEKLRAILAKARQLDAGMTTHESCATWLRTLIQPFADAVAALERRERSRSDIVAAAIEWAPHIMATLASESPTDVASTDRAKETEAILAQQCFRFLTALLRAGITSTPATYDPQVLDKHLPDILEIATIISTHKGKESHHG